MGAGHLPTRRTRTLLLSRNSFRPLNRIHQEAGRRRRHIDSRAIRRNLEPDLRQRSAHILRCVPPRFSHPPSIATAAIKSGVNKSYHSAPRFLILKYPGPASPPLSVMTLTWTPFARRNRASRRRVVGVSGRQAPMPRLQGSPPGTPAQRPHRQHRGTDRRSPGHCPDPHPLRPVYRTRSCQALLCPDRIDSRHNR